MFKVIRELLSYSTNVDYRLNENSTDEIDQHIDKVLNELGDKIVTRYKRDKDHLEYDEQFRIRFPKIKDMTHVTPQHIFDFMVHCYKANPEPLRKYVQWIMNRFVNNEILLTYKDISEIGYALEWFDKVKNNLETKDINQFKTVKDLHKFMIEHEHKINSLSAKELKRKEKQIGIEVIVHTPNIKIISILTKEAMNLYGSHTKWCTTSKVVIGGNKFDEFIKRGKLYVIITKDRKFIFQAEGIDMRDELDEFVTDKDIKLLSSFPEYKKFLIDILSIKHYHPDPDARSPSSSNKNPKTNPFSSIKDLYLNPDELPSINEGLQLNEDRAEYVLNSMKDKIIKAFLKNIELLKDLEEEHGQFELGQIQGLNILSYIRRINGTYNDDVITPTQIFDMIVKNNREEDREAVKINVEWIMNIFIKRNLILKVNDVQELGKFVSEFEKIKNKIENKDINQFEHKTLLFHFIYKFRREHT